MKDLSGRRFGSVTAISYAGRKADGNHVWTVRCDCGHEKTALYCHLLAGKSTSCCRGNLCPFLRHKRFMEKVEIRKDGCWLWRAYIRPNGYGEFTDKQRRTIGAHVVSYEMFTGRHVPTDSVVCHKCDVKCCVNPDHLFLGTQSENMADKVQKKRQARGQSHGMSKVTPEIVRQIRDKSASGISAVELSREYAITPTHISRIIRGLAWTHLS